MNLLFRLIKTLICGYFGKKLSVSEASHTSYMCWPNDLDTNLHMNNGRYLTLLDLGRTDFLIRTGLAKQVLKHKWMPVLASAKIEFKKPIHLWEKFDITTEFIGCDEKRFYIQQIMHNQKKEVLFKAVVKAAFVKKRKSVPVQQVFESLGHTKISDTLPNHVKLWLDSEK